MAERVPKNKPILASEGETTNPLDSAVVADTGALNAGIYEFRIYIGATAAAHFMVQRRNAANGANVGVTPVFYAAAGQTGCYPLTITLEDGERVRVILDDALTGDCAVTINGEKLG